MANTKAQDAAAAVEAKRIELATAPDPQTGMDQVKGELPTKAAAKKAMQAQFDAADAKGDPDAADAALSRAMRGY